MNKKIGVYISHEIYKVYKMKDTLQEALKVKQAEILKKFGKLDENKQYEIIANLPLIEGKIWDSFKKVTKVSSVIAVCIGGAVATVEILERYGSSQLKDGVYKLFKTVGMDGYLSKMSKQWDSAQDASMDQINDLTGKLKGFYNRVETYSKDSLEDASESFTAWYNDVFQPAYKEVISKFESMEKEKQIAVIAGVLVVVALVTAKVLASFVKVMIGTLSTSEVQAVSKSVKADAKKKSIK